MNLVTGATGFIGSYLTKLLLSKGEKVRAIKRSPSDLSLLGNFASQIEWIEADVLDVVSLHEAMDSISNVYHCAAAISFIPAEYENMMKVNAEGTANVVNAALKNGVKKFLHVSSVAAFGLPANEKIIDEKYTDPNVMKCFWYYKSKHLGEREVWRANAEGLDVIIVCPSTVIGAGWWYAEPNAIFDAVYNGLKFYTNGTNGFVDVRDVAECCYRLMQSETVNEKYIITAENTDFKTLIWQIADELRVKRPPFNAGKILRSIAWRTEVAKTFFTRQRPLITKEVADLASIKFTYSNEKIKQTLNYNFKPLRQTIADTAQAYLHSKKEGKEFGIFL